MRMGCALVWPLKPQKSARTGRAFTLFPEAAEKILQSYFKNTGLIHSGCC